MSYSKFFEFHVGRFVRKDVLFALERRAMKDGLSLTLKEDRRILVSSFACSVSGPQDAVESFYEFFRALVRRVGS